MSDITKDLIFVVASVAMLLLLLLLSSCTLTPDIEGIIDKSGKSIGTVLVAKAGSVLADTRKIKANTVATIKDETLKSETLISLAKNNRYKGFIEGVFSLLILIFFGKIVRYFYPKRKTTITTG